MSFEGLEDDSELLLFELFFVFVFFFPE